MSRITLEDLYYCYISPHERDIMRGSRMNKLVKIYLLLQKVVVPKLLQEVGRLLYIFHIKNCYNQ